MLPAALSLLSFAGVKRCVVPPHRRPKRCRSPAPEVCADVEGAVAPGVCADTEPCVAAGPPVAPSTASLLQTRASGLIVVWVHGCSVGAPDDLLTVGVDACSGRLVVVPAAMAPLAVPAPVQLQNVCRHRCSSLGSVAYQVQAFVDGWAFRAKSRTGEVVLRKLKHWGDYSTVQGAAVGFNAIKLALASADAHFRAAFKAPVQLPREELLRALGIAEGRVRRFLHDRVPLPPGGLRSAAADKVPKTAADV